MRFCLLSGFFVLAALILHAQQPDSLLNALDTAKGQWKVKTYNELFRWYVGRDPVMAIGFAREALDLALETGDRRGLAAAYNNLGVAYRNQGVLDRALDHYLHALRIYDSLQNDEGRALTSNNIATIYSLKKDYGQAMRYLEQSYKELVQLGDQNRIVGSLNNLGILYSDLQLNEQAMKHFTEAYQLSVQLGRPHADPLENIGNIFFQQGNYQRAIEYYTRALEIERNNNNRIGILNVLTNTGIAFLKAGQTARAQEYLAEAENLASQLASYSAMPIILKSKAENLYKQGRAGQAYQTMIAYDSAREKIYGDESTRRIAQLEMAVRLQEKEKEYDILQKEDAIKSLQLRNSRLFIVTVVLIILVLIAFVNVYLTGSKKKISGTP